MTKKSLSETDICAKWITPAVVQAGWDEETQIRREVGFTKGRIIVRGKLVTRGKAKRADYVLYYQTVPIAVIEAKDNNHAVGDGMQQALEYAETLAVPFVFSSNGDGFVFHDRTGMGAKLEVTLSLGEFPSPSKLWAQYLAWKGLGPQQEKIVLQPYYDDGSGKEPRYYQSNAINASVEAIAKGQNRVLLVMATGTGKTYTAFQIIWRLWKAGQKKRILFLADRNVLIDQTMVNDFRPFGPAMAKLSTGTKTIERADGTLVIDERTQRVAKWVSDYLKESGDRFQKTIVFCVDTEHAARMRQALVNENKDLVQKNDRYVMRITGNDPQGSAQIGNFIDPESIYPVIVTTSKLLSTGVDAQTCRLIVLDREIGSMTEFKQIVGRGTRVHEDSKKYYFTLVDFRKATNHFADPEFDGEPVQIYEPGEGDPETPPDDVPPLNDDDDEDPIPPEPGEDETIVDGEPPDITLPPDGGDVPRKFYVHGKPVSVLTERIEYLDEDGKLVTESLRDYSRKAIRKQYASLEQFLRRWSTAERKEVIMEELAEEGLLLGPLQEEVGKDLDPFDLICHIAFDQPPLTRRERANNVRKRDVFTKYGPQARSILEALLAKYQDEGIVSGLDNAKILEIPPFNTMGTPFQLIKQFGSRAGFENAVHELQTALYQEVA
ncbi:restriction endonuclease [Burkholderia pseudomallei]|nr:type I restriction-modification enzyme R subunit C-terminal domain-containing protein [Burkholderia pseudomallei]ARL16268.1 restriction endonuclease [Burkholderia pseudomallei]